MTDAEAKDVVDGLFFVFNAGAVVLTEVAEVALNETEKEALHEPLDRIVKRMSPTASKRFQTLADPIAIIVCMGMWLNRITPLIQQHNIEKRLQKNVNGISDQPTGFTG